MEKLYTIETHFIHAFRDNFELYRFDAEKGPKASRGPCWVVMDMADQPKEIARKPIEGETDNQAILWAQHEITRYLTGLGA